MHAFVLWRESVDGDQITFPRLARCRQGIMLSCTFAQHWRRTGRPDTARTGGLGIGRLEDYLGHERRGLEEALERDQPDHRRRLDPSPEFPADPVTECFHRYKPRIDTQH